MKRYWTNKKVAIILSAIIHSALSATQTTHSTAVNDAYFKIILPPTLFYGVKDNILISFNSNSYHTTVHDQFIDSTTSLRNSQRGKVYDNPIYHTRRTKLLTEPLDGSLTTQSNFIFDYNGFDFSTPNPLPINFKYPYSIRKRRLTSETKHRHSRHKIHLEELLAQAQHSDQRRKREIDRQLLLIVVLRLSNSSSVPQHGCFLDDDTIFKVVNLTHEPGLTTKVISIIPPSLPTSYTHIHILTLMPGNGSSTSFRQISSYSTTVSRPQISLDLRYLVDRAKAIDFEVEVRARGSHRPINIPLHVSLMDGVRNETLHEMDVTTDEHGLASGSISLEPNIISAYKVDEVNRLRLQISTSPYGVRKESLIIIDPHAERRWLSISYESVGLQSGVMVAQINVRRPGVTNFVGQARIEYCVDIPRHHCGHQKKHLRKPSTRFQISELNLTFDSVVTFNTTIVEYETGMTQHHITTLPCSSRVTLSTSSLPRFYIPGQPLRVQFTAFNSSNQPETTRCYSIKFNANFRRRCADAHGLVSTRLNSPMTSTPVLLQIKDENSRETWEFPGASRTEVFIITLSQYVFRVGELIQAKIQAETPTNGLGLMITSCDGRVLHLHSPVSQIVSLPVTLDMYPCGRVSLIQENITLDYREFYVLSPFRIEPHKNITKVKPGSELEFIVNSDLSDDLLELQPAHLVITMWSRGEDVESVHDPYRILQAPRIHSVDPDVSFFTGKVAFDEAQNPNCSLPSLFNSTVSSSRSESLPYKVPCQSQARTSLTVEPGVVRQQFRLTLCEKKSRFIIRLPELQATDYIISPSVSMKGLETIRLKELAILTESDIVVSVKAHESSLMEGEQLQINLALFSNLISRTPQVHVRLVADHENAFCFKNLIINSYPHINMTLLPGTGSTVTFIAVALRRGDHTIQAEVLLDDEVVSRRKLEYQVEPVPFSHELQTPARRLKSSHLDDERKVQELSQPAGLQVKMRYEKADNQKRCKGFRLTVDHHVVTSTTPSPSVNTESPFYHYDYEDFFRDVGADKRKKRDTLDQSDVVKDQQQSRIRKKRRIQSRHPYASKHMIKICYRILQKSSLGSYYIDVESFSGMSVNEPLAHDSNSGCNIKSVSPYEHGNVIMVENTKNHNQSWCCFTVLMESTTSANFNSSGSVRMSNKNRPGDFCLEFYNSATSSPYSDHICSQHGCLCTENAHSACKQKYISTRKITLGYGRVYWDSYFAFQARVISRSPIDFKGFVIDELEVVQAYGKTSIRPGRRVHVYQKRDSSCSESIKYNRTIMVMGKQLYVDTGNELSLYLDKSSTVINMEEISQREDSFIIECFLDKLICPAPLPGHSIISTIPPPRTNTTFNSLLRAGDLLPLDSQTLGLPELSTPNTLNPTQKFSSSEQLFSVIYRNCRQREILTKHGVNLYRLDEILERNQDSCGYSKELDEQSNFTSLLRQLRREKKYRA